MNEVITKTNTTTSPGAPTRGGDYTGILPSQKILEMQRNGEITTTQLKQFDHDQVQPARADRHIRGRGGAHHAA